MRDGSQRSVNTQFSPRFGLGSRQVEGCFSLRLVSNGHPRPFVFSLSSFPKKHFEIKGSFAHLFPTARQSTRDRAQRLMGAEASAEGFLHSPSSWRYYSTPPGPRHGVANQLAGPRAFLEPCTCRSPLWRKEDVGVDLAGRLVASPASLPELTWVKSAFSPPSYQR